MKHHKGNPTSFVHAVMFQDGDDDFLNTKLHSHLEDLDSPMLVKLILYGICQWGQMIACTAHGFFFKKKTPCNSLLFNIQYSVLRISFFSWKNISYKSPLTVGFPAALSRLLALPPSNLSHSPRAQTLQRKSWTDINFYAILAKERFLNSEPNSSKQNTVTQKLSVKV